MRDLTALHAQAILDVDNISDEMNAATSRPNEERLALMEKSFVTHDVLSDIEAEMSGVSRLSSEELEIKVNEIERDIFIPIMENLGKFMDQLEEFESGQLTEWAMPCKERNDMEILLKQDEVAYSIVKKCICTIDCDHDVTFVKD